MLLSFATLVPRCYSVSCLVSELWKMGSSPPHLYLHRFHCCDAIDTILLGSMKARVARRLAGIFNIACWAVKKERTPFPH